MKRSDRNTLKWTVMMRRAIQLASLAEGDTSPNPLVGAIVLDNSGNIVGEGYHSKAGCSHAEVEALEQAGKRSRNGTLVVTLEPCCHQGRTPPCTELIIKSGITRVVVGMKDPDKRVSGKGISLLMDSGIEVIENVLQKQVEIQNRAFIHRVKTSRPWGILKCAMSLDGRIALPNGSSKWISSEASRLKVHRLRAQCDAVIIGGGTFRNDNPLLTSRGLSNPEPLRVLFTKSLDLPEEANLWDTSIARTLVAYGPEADKSLIRKLPESVSKQALIESTPKELLKELAIQGCNKILWECGPSLATVALKEKCVQEFVVFIAPKILGGLPAMTPLDNLGFEFVDQAFTSNNISLEKIGKDFVIKMIL